MKSTKTLSSATESAAIPVDMLQNPFAVSFAVVITGTCTYTVQHTLDNIFDSSVTPTWFDHSYVAGETTNQDGNYAFPVRGIRLKVSAYTSGTATITVLQGSS